MHIFFSGIGGAGLSSLALIAHEAGFEVSGSDKQQTDYIPDLNKRGIGDIHIGQSLDQIKQVHEKKPIDWFVYSSAITLENPDSPEIKYCQENGIKVSKRDEFINYLAETKNLKLVAVAGTHGKTTTTAMIVWLFKQLDLPVTYLIGSKVSFGPAGSYKAGSKYFVIEADEFDRTFLSFEPYLSVICGVSWDHHEIFPTREDYQEAFREFISQSHETLLWSDDYDYLNNPDRVSVIDPAEKNDQIKSIKLFGQYNRLDGFLAISAVSKLTDETAEDLIKLLNDFPGLSRRMEQIIPGLYTDYAHTPEKIRGAMSVALEMAEHQKKAVVIVYEPLTNRRQHFIKEEYNDAFAGAKKLYWVPSYLAREDKSQKILTPEELIENLDDPTIAEPAELDEALIKNIKKHLDDGDMVMCLSGGSGGSLDEWLRHHFKA